MVRVLGVIRGCFVQSDHEIHEIHETHETPKTHESVISIFQIRPNPLNPLNPPNPRSKISENGNLLKDEEDIIWKALSDPTRRKILDLLREGPKGTTEIVEAFPGM